MTTPHAKGSELERRIGEYLQSHGYTVSLNEFRTGRSGAKHELDVVGRKHDGITNYELIVECKAWKRAIDKDVVFKLSSELSDIGAAKGVIISLSGWTEQAEQSARNVNIELWGPKELSERFGELTVNNLHQLSTPVMSSGLTNKVDREDATYQIANSVKGIFGLGREEVNLVRRLWLPTWTLKIGTTRNHGVVRKTSHITHHWNSYEALSANCLANDSEKPNFVEIDISEDTIKPMLKVSEIEGYLRNAITAFNKAKDQQAKTRASVTLRRLGLTPPFAALTIESSQLTYYPIWIGVLSRGKQERVIAVNGLSGDIMKRTSTTLTAKIQHVRESVRN